MATNFLMMINRAFALLAVARRVLVVSDLINALGRPISCSAQNRVASETL